MFPRWNLWWLSPTCRKIPGPCGKQGMSPWIRSSSAPAPTAVLRICGLPPGSCKGKKPTNPAPYHYPATQAIYRQAMDEGLIHIFLDANAAVSTPTCGPCLGGYMGILARGERALATTNRNFVGRMGHPESEVYLAGPAVAAASAVAGRIIHPEEVL
jgi:hypothetical protein